MEKQIQQPFGALGNHKPLVPSTTCGGWIAAMLSFMVNRALRLFSICPIYISRYIYLQPLRICGPAKLAYLQSYSLSHLIINNSLTYSLHVIVSTCNQHPSTHLCLSAKVPTCLFYLNLGISSPEHFFDLPAKGPTMSTGLSQLPFTTFSTYVSAGFILDMFS